MLQHPTLQRVQMIQYCGKGPKGGMVALINPEGNTRGVTGHLEPFHQITQEFKALAKQLTISGCQRYGQLSQAPAIPTRHEITDLGCVG